MPPYLNCWQATYRAVSGVCSTRLTQGQRQSCISVKAVHSLLYQSSPFVSSWSQQGCSEMGELVFSCCCPAARTQQPLGQGRWKQPMIVVWNATCLLKYLDRTFCLQVSWILGSTSDLIPVEFPQTWHKWELWAPQTVEHFAFKITLPNGERPKFKNLFRKSQF